MDKLVDNYDNDLLFAQLSDLTNENFRGWYMKMFYKLGKNEVLRLAQIARTDGKQPKKLFSLLLKKSILQSK